MVGDEQRLRGLCVEVEKLVNRAQERQGEKISVSLETQETWGERKS